MSVLLLNDEIYHKTLEGIDKALSDDAYPVEYLKYRVESIIKHLHESVYKSYRDRYQKDRIEYVPLETSKRWYAPEEISLERTLKRLECIRYQCLDMPDWDNASVRYEIDALIDAFTRRLLNSIPEYRNAEWAA